MARQFIYHMQGLTKAYPGNRKVLENIGYSSFYPDDETGALGVNGAGKSTLLRIMAGLDIDYTGEGWIAEGARVGYSGPGAATRCGKVVCCERTSRSASRRRRRSSTATTSWRSIIPTRPPTRWTKLQEEIEAKGLWDLDFKVDQAMDALRCPADGAEVEKLSRGERRRVALCRLLLGGAGNFCRSTSRPITSTPSS